MIIARASRSRDHHRGFKKGCKSSAASPIRLRTSSGVLACRIVAAPPDSASFPLPGKLLVLMRGCSRSAAYSSPPHPSPPAGLRTQHGQLEEGKHETVQRNRSYVRKCAVFNTVSHIWTVQNIVQVVTRYTVRNALTLNVYYKIHLVTKKYRI